MSVTLINDGRLIGLVYADIEIAEHGQVPGVVRPDQVVAPACKAPRPLPACTTARRWSNRAPATTWLWADNLRLSPAGAGAAWARWPNRARSNNPF